MLTQEQNDRLSRVGPGTPMGELMRRYWHPIAGSVELEENPVKKVRLLCEDLVLYRDRSGNLGLIDEPCPHRRVSMEYGIPEHEGIRCPYHGWVFNHEGRCLEQPAEPWDSTFKDRVTTKAYRVQEKRGIVFAYLGPEPAPLLPNYDVLVWDNGLAHIGISHIPCNWLQCMENSADPTHAEWLHGYYGAYVLRKKGDPKADRVLLRRHTRIGFDRFEHGIIKRRIGQGQTEEADTWKFGHPIVFPHIVHTPFTLSYRVPVDDHATMNFSFTVYRPGIPIAPQESVPVYEVPLYDRDGKFYTEVVLVQDIMAWASQKPIAERDKEHLGVSDLGVIMYRELLEEQVRRVEQGLDPMEVYRDPATNVRIDLPQEHGGFTSNRATRLMENLSIGTEQYSPLVDTLRDLYLSAAEQVKAGKELLRFPEFPVYPVGSGPDFREARLMPE